MKRKPYSCAKIWCYALRFTLNEESSIAKVGVISLGTMGERSADKVGIALAEAAGWQSEEAGK